LEGLNTANPLSNSDTFKFEEETLRIAEDKDWDVEQSLGKLLLMFDLPTEVRKRTLRKMRKED